MLSGPHDTAATVVCDCKAARFHLRVLRGAVSADPGPPRIAVDGRADSCRRVTRQYRCAQLYVGLWTGVNSYMYRTKANS